MSPDRHAADLTLLGVFPERRAAQVVDALRQTGVPEAEIRVGDPDDEVLAKRAEMQVEASASWFSPTVGVLYPEEAAKGLVVAVAVGSIIGAVLVAPFGFIEMGDFALWIRLLFMAGAGALAGGAIEPSWAPPSRPAGPASRTPVTEASWCGSTARTSGSSGCCPDSGRFGSIGSAWPMDRSIRRSPTKGSSPTPGSSRTWSPGQPAHTDFRDG